MSIHEICSNFHLQESEKKTIRVKQAQTHQLEYQKEILLQYTFLDIYT